MIKKTLVMAKYTFYELFETKILWTIGFLGLLIPFLSFIFSEMTFGVPERIAIDMGIGILSLLSVGMSILMGVNLINKEIENNTIQLILTRPLSRTSFILGKILGMSSILLINIFFLGLMSIVCYLFLGGTLNSLIFWCILFIFIESFLVLMMTLFLSSIMRNVLAVFSSIVLYIIGHSLVHTQNIYTIKMYPVFQKVLYGVSFVLPNYDKLNLKNFLLYRQTLSSEHLFGSLSYGISYSLFLLFITIILFNRRTFE